MGGFNLIFNTFSGFPVSVAWFLSDTSLLGNLLVSAGEGFGELEFIFWFRFLKGIISVIVS